MRPVYYAFIVSDRDGCIRFSRHFSRFGAEKKYGDLSRRYRGNPNTDYSLVIYSAEEFEAALSEDYTIDYKAGLLTPKRRRN